MAKAEITYSDIAFEDITTGKFCIVNQVTIDKITGGGLKNDGGRISLNGTTILNDGRVNNGKGQISITIGDSKAFPSDGLLTPKGFALIAKGNSDARGLKNFNSRSHNETDCTISLNAVHADGNGAQWKLVIMVQHDDGRVGVIDPDIENDY